jgi:spore maturation protein CgeB
VTTLNDTLESAGLAFYRSFLGPGDLCFDVGAHRGRRTDLFLGLGARVVSVEPQPRCVKILTDKYRDRPEVVIVPKGLAAEPGVRSLRLCEASDAISTFSDEWQTGRFHDERWDTAVDVPMTTLDSLIKEFGRPQFCKIDVEGLEVEVLHGLSEPIPAIAFEFTHEFMRNARTCVGLLQSLGYTEFDYTRGESFDLALPAWTDAERLFEHLSREPDPLTWGDIYARFAGSPTDSPAVARRRRVFYAAGDSPNPEVSSKGWRNNLYDSLRAAGHDVVEFVYDLDATLRHLDPNDPRDAAFIAENRPRLGAELLRQIQEAHERERVHVFFSYFYDACVEPAVIEQIKAMGIVTINWYCNASYQFHLVRGISPSYDYCLVPEKERLKDYRGIGATPIYCQEAANPAVYRPFPLAQEFDVTFVGQCYGDRADHVMWLRRRGIDVRVWGPRWHFHVRPRSRNPLRRLFTSRAGLPPYAVGGIPGDADMIRLYSRSKINLGFPTCGDTHLGPDRIVQIRLRDFEVPMSGGFYLTEHIDELREFFEFGREIETYQSREDMLDKIRFYLSHDAARDRIRHAGRARCIRDHTWTRRFESVFREIGPS